MSKANGKSCQRFTRPAPPSTREPGRRLSQATLALARQELATFHQLFGQHFDRVEQRCWSGLYLCGQLADLERKTMEPMVLALVGVVPEVTRPVWAGNIAADWARWITVRKASLPFMPVRAGRPS